MSRAELSRILHEFCDNVYFQPPEGTNIKYPCIIYELNGISKRRADNINYMMKREYEVKYITKAADPLGPDGETGFLESFLTRFTHVRFNRIFVHENLYHYVFQLNF